ncbi:MAG TPA: hypothetical protein VGO59_05490 [Verrucomicrobiae bacterium]|jgi:hypothetical protein
MNEWNIQSRSHVCQVCEKSFAGKEPYHTVLLEEKQQYQRLDICRACWESQYRDGASERKGFISQWQGVYHAPPAAPPDPIQKESAESLLRKLIETGDPKHGPVCYILAVMLERKRILKVKEQIHGERGRVFIYEHAKTGDVFTIADPNLQLGQLQQVQHDTAELLAGGLNPPSPAASEAAPEAAAEPAPVPAPAENLEENLGEN